MAVQLLAAAAVSRFQKYCAGDGNTVNFYTERTKKLSDLTASDVPPGLDPDDLASDYEDRG